MSLGPPFGYLTAPIVNQREVPFERDQLGTRGKFPFAFKWSYFNQQRHVPVQPDNLVYLNLMIHLSWS